MHTSDYCRAFFTTLGSCWMGLGSIIHWLRITNFGAVIYGVFRPNSIVKHIVFTCLFLGYLITGTYFFFKFEFIESLRKCRPNLTIHDFLRGIIKLSGLFKPRLDILTTALSCGLHVHVVSRLLSRFNRPRKNYRGSQRILRGRRKKGNMSSYLHGA